mmetsp:Transcript_31184/g.70173  ORF Transcript_31184/g.70173 Transcript_31184/m.70173 type:complete len:96 (+) Transcript_31184:333-620(+)|eukprot:764883-Hanusia_phi.AAC.3
MEPRRILSDHLSARIDTLLKAATDRKARADAMLVRLESSESGSSSPSSPCNWSRRSSKDIDALYSEAQLMGLQLQSILREASLIEDLGVYNCQSC